MGKEKKKKLSRQHYQRPIENEVQEQEFQVEKIVGCKGEGNKTLYFIKWKGYSDADNTWEPAENLTNCPELLEEFRTHQGVRDGLEEKESAESVEDETNAATYNTLTDNKSEASSSSTKYGRESRKKVPKKAAVADRRNGDEQTQSGFERGLQLEKIMGATEGTDGDLKGAILFLVKW